jgi:hypothetical protein
MLAMLRFAFDVYKEQTPERHLSLPFAMLRLAYGCGLSGWKATYKVQSGQARLSSAHVAAGVPISENLVRDIAPSVMMGDIGPHFNSVLVSHRSVIGVYSLILSPSLRCDWLFLV